MDIAKFEIVAIEEMVQEAALNELCTLNDLQLALVGGGFADPIFA